MKNGMRIASLDNKKVEPVQPVQVNIYESHTFRKDLPWLHFDVWSRAEEKHQLYNQQSVSIAYQT